LTIEFDRPSDNLASVTFSMAISDFEEASQVIKIISGEVDPLRAGIDVSMNLSV
jgi:hypothetical protein